MEQFVPAYRGTVERDGELFLQMSDLLTSFDGPNVMDCKMGVRLEIKNSKNVACKKNCRFIDRKAFQRAVQSNDLLDLDQYLCFYKITKCFFKTDGV